MSDTTDDAMKYKSWLHKYFALYEHEPGLWRSGCTAPQLTIHGELYIEVDDVDIWYEKAVNKKIRIVQPVTDTSYGHRSFKFADPNNLIIGLFKYN